MRPHSPRSAAPGGAFPMEGAPTHRCLGLGVPRRLHSFGSGPGREARERVMRIQREPVAGDRYPADSSLSRLSGKDVRNWGPASLLSRIRINSDRGSISNPGLRHNVEEQRALRLDGASRSCGWQRSHGIVPLAAAEQRVRHEEVGDARRTPRRDRHVDRTYLSPPASQANSRSDVVSGIQSRVSGRCRSGCPRRETMESNCQMNRQQRLHSLTRYITRQLFRTLAAAHSTPAT